MIQVICSSLLLSAPGRAGAFSRDFTIIFAPECRAFSGALKIEKLKAPLIPGPEGAVDTNDWCITHYILISTIVLWVGPYPCANMEVTVPEKLWNSDY